VKYSVVIAELNEPDLAGTIENIKATQKNVGEIIVISDKKRQGPMRCRHEGIKKSAHRNVIITDAHMRFKPGALDVLAEFTADNPGSVNCAKCHHNSAYSFDDSPYGGADLFYKQVERGQYSAISAKWRNSNKPGEIGAVMGACYAFDTLTYSDAGEPWRIGLGWGCDEESISILARLLGGSVNLVDVECAHLYRAQTQLQYTPTPEQIAGVWVNRLAMLEILPMPQTQRHDLRGWLHNNRDCKNTLVLRMLNQISPAIEQVAEQIRRNQKISWKDYAAEWLNTKQELKDMTRQDLMKNCRKAGIKFKFNATKKELFKLLNGFDMPEESPAQRPKRQYTTNKVAVDRGIRCPHCGYTDRKHGKITNTYPNGNRRMICGKCEMPFIVTLKF
jgi:hypothetical protein